MNELSTIDHEDLHRPVASAYASPEDVLMDHRLSSNEKRAILASWLSDARSISAAPALRRFDNGALAHVDDIYSALKSLDGPAAQNPCMRRHNIRRSGRTFGKYAPRWIRKRNGKDDEPPPSPAAIAVAAFRPPVAAIAHKTNPC